MSFHSKTTVNIGLLPDMLNCGLRMRRECRERFIRNRRLAIPTGITARARRTCRDACRDRLLTVSFCRGPNASNPARGRTLPGQERPSNGRPDASQRRPGSMVCPVGLPGALSVDILALLLYWPTYAPITVRLILLSYSEEQLLCTILCTVLAYFNLLFLL